MARPAPLRQLRRSLHACTSEGVAAEVVAACVSGVVTTAWALHLGCGAHVIALLGAMPFLAQLCQLPGAWLTSRLGARRAALVTVALSRQAFLPLATLPWLPLEPEGRRALLVGCCAAHHALGILCNNAWVTWVGELVPSPVRGRYFGRRTALCTVASALATLAVGTGLDHARAAALSSAALAALALAACLVGAISVWLMARQHGGLAGAAPPWTLAAAVRPLADVRARRLLAYTVLWHVAIGLSAPFFNLYLLQDLGTGFAVLAWTTAAATLARTITAPAWGRVVDRVGARPVLVACTAGLAVSPLAWIGADGARFWPVAVDAVIGGALLGGHGVASFTLPLAIAPPRERPHYHAAFSMAGGGAFTAASVCGGALVSAAPRLLGGDPGAPLPAHLTFAASLAMRVAAAGAALAILDGSAAAARSRGWSAARTWAPRVAGVTRVRSFAVRTGHRWMARATAAPKKREAALAASSARGPGAR